MHVQPSNWTKHPLQASENFLLQIYQLAFRLPVLLIFIETTKDKLLYLPTNRLVPNPLRLSPLFAQTLLLVRFVFLESTEGINRVSITIVFTHAPPTLRG
jgi:hypothetical protein